MRIINFTNKKKFALIIWNLNVETFIVHIIVVKVETKTINPLNKITILIEYLHFANIFLL